MHISRLASELIYDYNDPIPKTAFMHDSVVYECRFVICVPSIDLPLFSKHSANTQSMLSYP
jgi:hypothetical protein